MSPTQTGTTQFISQVRQMSINRSDYTQTKLIQFFLRLGDLAFENLCELSVRNHVDISESKILKLKYHIGTNTEVLPQSFHVSFYGRNSKSGTNDITNVLFPCPVTPMSQNAAGYWHE